MKINFNFGVAGITTILFIASLAGCSSKGGTYGTNIASTPYAISTAHYPDSKDQIKGDINSKIEYHYDGDSENSSGPFGNPL